MKGIIFNLLEEVVTEQLGDATWDQLLEAAELDGAYTSLGSYPDADLLALVSAASAALDKPADDVVRCSASTPSRCWRRSTRSCSSATARRGRSS